MSLKILTSFKPLKFFWRLERSFLIVFKLVEKFIPEAEITYTAEEHGCEIFYTNDPDLVGKYVVDSWTEDIESDWEMEEKTLIEILQKLMNTNETDIDKLSSLLYEGEYDISINKWEYKEVTEW